MMKDAITTTMIAATVTATTIIATGVIRTKRRSRFSATCSTSAEEMRIPRNTSSRSNLFLN